MADTKEKAPKAGAAKGEGAKGGATKAPREKAAAAATDPKPKAVEGTPRLRTHYDQVVRPNLAKQFGITNPMQLPRLTKVVLNVGLGEASKNPKALDSV